MPFICLANANIPDGTLQITDLWPNESQRNQSIDPPGQNRYLRRPGTGQPKVNILTGNVEGIRADSNLATFEGLAAYLVDKVEPGALAQATGDVILAANPQALDRIVINGVIFIEFSAGLNDATTAGTTVDPFIVQIAGSAALTGDNVDTVLTDPAAIVTMRGLNANVFVDSTNAAGTLTFDALFTGGGAQLGAIGDMTVTVPVGAARITAPTLGRLGRANEGWDEVSIPLAVNAVQLRVDTGLGMTLANVNTALAAAGAELTGAAASSASVGTLAEFLSVLAGRKYELDAASNKFTAVTDPDKVHDWLPALKGSFTAPNTVFDSQMYGGEWGPDTTTTGLAIAGVAIPDRYLKRGRVKDSATVGGEVVNNEIGEARATFDGTHFQASVLNGQLARYAQGITLFPDADVQAHVAQFLSSKQTRQATLVNQRIVTVYDDDGTLLV